MEKVLYIFFVILLLYLLLGLAFSIAFLLKGLTKVDEDAKGTSIYFKAIILPGVILFWPALLKKWLRPNN